MTHWLSRRSCSHLMNLATAQVWPVAGYFAWYMGHDYRDVGAGDLVELVLREALLQRQKVFFRNALSLW